MRRVSGTPAAARLSSALMERLRKECPWDRKQTFRDLSGYLLEECYEALDALAREDWDGAGGRAGRPPLRDRLPRAARERARRLRLRDASPGASTTRWSRATPTSSARPPCTDADGVRVQWEELKRKEREKEGRPPSPFDGVPRALPALLKAVRLTSRAADLGFDWERDADVLVEAGRGSRRVQGRAARAGRRARRSASPREIGDLLFTVVNVARRHGVDPEAALQGTNDKFRRRFEEVARRAEAAGKERQGRRPSRSWTPLGSVKSEEHEEILRRLRGERSVRSTF